MMGWAAGFFGAGGVVLVGVCVVGMGLLIWLLFRLTGAPSVPVARGRTRDDLDRSFAQQRRMDSHSTVAASPGASPQPPSRSLGSDSVGR
jgi:hypothetical protein